MGFLSDFKSIEFLGDPIIAEYRTSSAAPAAGTGVEAITEAKRAASPTRYRVFMLFSILFLKKVCGSIFIIRFQVTARGSCGHDRSEAELIFFFDVHAKLLRIVGVNVPMASVVWHQ